MRKIAGRRLAATLTALALALLLSGCGLDWGCATEICSADSGTVSAAGGAGRTADHGAQGAPEAGRQPQAVPGGPPPQSAAAPALGIVVPLVPGLGLDTYSQNCDLFDDPYGACL